MLSFINQKGPLTEGIFRKSASIKECRALKEKLNSGDKVNLDDESVLVVASVLKVEKVLALSTHGVTLKLYDPLVLHHDYSRTIIVIKLKDLKN